MVTGKNNHNIGIFFIKSPLELSIPPSNTILKLVVIFFMRFPDEIKAFFIILIFEMVSLLKHRGRKLKKTKNIILSELRSQELIKVFTNFLFIDHY